MKLNINKGTTVAVALLGVATLFANPFKGSNPTMSDQVEESEIHSPISRAPASLQPPVIARQFQNSAFTQPITGATTFHSAAVSNFRYEEPFPQQIQTPAANFFSTGANLNSGFVSSGGAVYSANSFSEPASEPAPKKSETRAPAWDDTSPSNNAIGSYGGLPNPSPANTNVSNPGTQSSANHAGPAASAPKTLIAVGSSGAVSLSWTASSDTSVTYTIERSLSATIGFTVVMAGLNSTTYTDTSVVNGLTYYYRVYSLNANGGSYSDVVSALTSGLPTAPALTLTASNGSASLSWTTSTGTGPITYSVERSLSSGTGFAPVTSALTSPVFIDSSIANGTLYYYRVQAHNSAGDSAYSSEITAQGINAFLLASAVAGQTSTTLTWANATGATTYDVQYGTTSGTYTTSLTNKTSPFTATGLTAGTAYFFSIRATNANHGLTLSTNELTATPLGSFSITSLTATDIGKSKIIWGASTGATSYDIGCSTTSGIYTGVTLTNQTSPTTITGLNNSTAYYCRVTAKNASGSLASSTEATATTFSLLTYTWPFDAGTEAAYSFDSSKLELVGGVSRLKNFTPTDASYIGNDFKDAILSGVKWDAPNAKLVLDSASDDGELNSRWTPKYQKIVGYWKLNDTSQTSIPAGTIVRATIGSDGVAQNANGLGFKISSGKQREAYEFDGVDDQVLISSSQLPMGASPRTMCSWFNSYSSTPTRAVAAYGNGAIEQGFGIVQTAGSVVVSGFAVSTTAIASIELNRWYQVCGTYDGTSMKAYVDGQYVSSLTTGLNTQLGDLHIGNQVHNFEPWHGLVDEVVVFSTELSAAEIKTIYERQSARYTGTILSRVMNSGASTSWAGIKYLTNLPYGKELPNNGDSEKISDYSQLTTAPLSGNLKFENFSSTGDTTGKVGLGKAFNGNLQYDAGVVTGLNATSAMTITGWVKQNQASLSTVQEFARLESVFAVQLQDGHATFFINNGMNYLPTPPTAAILQDGQWHMLTATYDNSNMKVYIDANLMVNYPQGPITFPAVASNLFYGSFAGPDERLDGALDEMGLYQRALSPTEITSLYQTRSHLMSGNVGLWHLNETSGITYSDSSGLGNHGTLSGIVLSKKGKFGNAPYFDGISAEINAPVPTLGNQNVSVSAWINLPGLPSQGAFLKIGSVGDGYALGVGDGSIFSNPGRHLMMLFEGYRWIDTGFVITSGWHHVAMVIDPVGTPQIYWDGNSVGSFAGTNAASPTDHLIHIGGYTGSMGEPRHFNGQIDEVGLWSRSLSTTEVQQLYQRGANRILTQARTCANADCSDDPTGSNWIGSSASPSTYLSEASNSSVNSPDFLFTNFGGNPANQPYFQYRAVLQSDDSATSPDLVSVSAGPARFDGSNPVVMPVDGPTFAVYTGFTTTLGASCTGTPKFQLSHDKQTWYYYSAGMWNTTTAGVTQASDSSVINTNIGTFGAIAGTGALYAKIFYPSNTSTACEIDSIAVAGADVNSTNTTNPGAFTVTSITSTNGTATLNWNAASASTSYKVCYGTTQALANACATFVTVTGTSTTISSLVNDTQYYFNVVASNASGTTASHTPVVTTPMAIPSTPTSLAAVSGLFSTQLTWNASTGSGNVTYQVKRATVTGGPYTTIASGVMTNAYSDLTALANVSYYYVVSASNAGGTSANSNEASAKALGSFSITSAYGIDSTILLTWGAAAGATSYDISYGTSSANYTTTLSNQTSPTQITGLLNNTVYYVKVAAQNSAGSANSSAEVTVKPVAPTALTGVAGVESAVLSWATPAGATGFNVKYGTTSGTYTTTLAGQTSPLTVTGLTGGQTYYFAVDSINPQNGIATSNELSLTVFSPVNYTWTFDQSTDSSYTFDSSKIEFVGGSCRLINTTPNDSSYLGNDFKAATLSGVVWNSAKNKLTLDITNQEGELNSKWTPKYHQLVGYWKLNGTGESAIADGDLAPATIGTDLIATNTNATGMKYIAAKQRQGVEFDGVDDSFATGPVNLLGTSDDFTVSGWIKPNATQTDWASVIDYSHCGGNNFVLQQFSHSQGLYNFAYYASDSTFKQTHFNLAPDEWQHFVATKSGANVKLFINGAMISDTTFNTGTIVKGTLPLMLGQATGACVGRPFKGDLDEVAIWKTSLTPTEVKSVFEHQQSRYSGTVLSRIFNAGSNTSWLGFSYLTTLPYGKEMPSNQGIEAAPDYVRSNTPASALADAFAYYKLDETSAGLAPGGKDLTDSSGHGNHGVQNSPDLIYAQSGVLGNSISFTHPANGGSFNVNASTNPFITGVATISFWMYWDGTSTVMPFGFQQYDLWIYNTSFGFNTGQGDIFGISNASLANQWVYVTAEFHESDVTQNKIYINGVPQALTQRMGTPNPLVAVLGPSYGVGGWRISDTYGFSGRIDEMGIWSRALSQQEINELQYNQQGLMYKNMALYHLNEKTGTTLKDFSGNSRDATLTGSFTLDQPGKLNGAVKFDGSTAYAQAPMDGSKLADEFTLSAWINHRSMTEWGSVLSMNVNHVGEPAIVMVGTSNSIGMNGVGITSDNISVDLGADHYNQWIFTTVRKKGSNLYVDAWKAGQHLSNSGPIPFAMSSSSTQMYIGRHYTPSAQIFDGLIDEAGVWSRALTDNEIQQVYQRGANRVKMQFRACSNATCSDDPNEMNWKGNVNAPQSYFSELNNVASSDPKLTYVKGLFADSSYSFPSVPYFQYKAVLESDDAAYSPDLASVVLGPSRYDGGAPTVIPVNGPAYQMLTSFTVNLGAGGCTGTPKFQLSPDKTNWYYYHSGWVNAGASADISKANPASTLNTNISTFTATAGSGTLYVRAFLPSDTTTACDIDSIAVQGGHSLPTNSTNPDAFKITSVIGADSQAVVTWNTASGATGYTVCYGTTQAQADACASSYNAGSATTATITGLTNNTQYYFGVVATNASGRSPASLPGTGVPVPLPLTPASLAASGGLLSVNLTWASTADATSYTLLRGTAPGSLTVYASGITSTAYTDLTAGAGTVYYYAVRAVNATGSSANSNVVSASGLGSFTANVDGSYNQSIRLSWTPSIGATSYTVKYGTSPGTYSSTLNNQTSPIIISALTNETKYYVQVTALNANGSANALAENRTTPWLYPNLSIANTSLYQGGVAQFTITMDQASLHPVTVTLSTANGTAYGAVDYTPRTNATVTIPAGQTTGFFKVNTNAELGVSGATRQFTATMTAAQAGLLTGATVGTATLTDPSIEINLSTILDPRISFSRLSAATYFDASGVMRTSNANLTLWSEDPSHAGWTIHNDDGSESGAGAASLTFSDVPGMSGNTVKQIHYSGSQTMRFMQDIGGLENSDYTYSIWAKDTGLCAMSISINDQGTWTGSVGSGYTASDSVNGWKRWSVTKNITSGGARFVFYIPAGQECIIGGAQFEKGSVATGYVKTTSSPAYLPRIDYDLVTHTAKGLLLESASTNLLLYSSDFSGSSNWANDGTAPIMTANYGVAPDGTTTSTKLDYSGGGGANWIRSPLPTMNSGDTYTCSVFARGSGNFMAMIQEGGSDFTFYGTNYFNPDSHWRRFTVTGTKEADGNPARFLVQIGPPSNIEIWGAQCEVGTGATSYIPTSGATATRNADSATIPNANWFTSSGGTLAIDSISSAAGDGTARSMELTLTNGDFIGVEYRNGLSTLEAAMGGYYLTTGLNVIQDTLTRQVASISNLHMNLASRGVLSDTLTRPLSYGASSISLGVGSGGSSYLNGHVRKISFYSQTFDTYARTNLSSIDDQSCKTLLASGVTVSGIYTIKPDGYSPISAYCDMTTDGGGWTLIARSVVAGNSNFGWKEMTGDITNDTAPYSLGSKSAGLSFSEMLLGNYTTAKTWGTHVYKHSLPTNFVETYLVSPLVRLTPTPVIGTNTNFGMATYIGYTLNTNEFFFRDGAGAITDTFGLHANGWATYYPDSDPAGATGFGGFLFGLQGMIMVR